VQSEVRVLTIYDIIEFGRKLNASALKPEPH